MEFSDKHIVKFDKQASAGKNCDWKQLLAWSLPPFHSQVHFLLATKKTLNKFVQSQQQEILQ